MTGESCKAWLTKNDKHTYGDIMDELLEELQEDEVTPSKSVGKPRGSYVYTSKGPVLPGSPAARRKPK